MADFFLKRSGGGQGFWVSAKERFLWSASDSGRLVFDDLCCAVTAVMRYMWVT